MKKRLALFLTLVMAISMVALPLSQASAEVPTINLLSMSSSEKIVNVVRDQLVKNGFDVNVNLQPDYSSYKALVDGGNFDIAVSGWTTVTGNPDYAVRSIMKTGGDYNIGFIADSHVDDLVEKAATETADQYVATYGELEKYITEEKAYFLPLYRGIKTQGVNTELLDLSTVRISQARSMVWEKISFNDTSKNETDPIVLAQALSDLTSLDPIKANDGSINQLNSNMYIRIVNLTDDDKVIPEGSLSYSFSIAEGNQAYYFILRDDVNFAKVEDMQSADTGVRVGGEDVVFSLNRAKDKDSVPNHRTYSLHENMDTITLVTDIAELESTVSSSGKSIREELEEKAPAAIAELVEGKDDVSNADGKYQVVRVTTTRPFPQVLNYLAHQSAGIVSQQQVESINTYDVASYDVTKDIAYGDQSTVTEGPTYDNTLWTSGPYIMIQKNDYQADFMRNPGYMPDAEYHPVVKNYTMRFIADTSSQVSALRAGEIYVLYSIPEESVELVEADPKLTVQETGSNAVTYGTFNLNTMPDENLRKAIVYSINQDEIIAVFDNRVFRAYSTLSPLVDTGNQLVADPAKVQEFIAAFEAAQ